MTTTSVRREQIAATLRDKEERDLFVSEQIDTGLPFQIRAIRQARGWSQKELAERAGMAQEGISRLESLDYGKYTLRTLKRLASAFDVGLVVRFEPFSQLVDWEANLSPKDLAVPDYEHDPGLRPADTTDVETTWIVDPMPPITDAVLVFTGRQMSPSSTLVPFPGAASFTGRIATTSPAEEAWDYTSTNTQVERSA